MARKSGSENVGKGGALHPDPYREVNNTDPNVPDTDQIYEDYAHRDKWHLSQEQADLESTPNSRSGEGIMGHQTPGEPSPMKPGHSPHD